MSDFTSPDADNPFYRSREYYRLEARWRFSRRVREINESIRKESEAILPKFQAEDPGDYKARVEMTFGFNALDETIHALTGLATADDPVLEDDVPERIRSEWEDADNEGTHGAVFAQQCLEGAIQDGHSAILVDSVPAPPGLRADEEEALGIRAYLVRVPVDRILSWRVARVFGRRVITQVAILESETVADGRFGTRLRERVRTLIQMVAGPNHPTRRMGDLYVTYTVEEQQPDKSVSVVESGELQGPRWIPFHPHYAGEKIGILDSRPPLLGLAYSNLEHTQIKSDRRYSEHKCAVAVPVFRGRDKTGAVTNGDDGGAVIISPSYGIDCSENGGAEYLEPKGTALAALQADLTDIERRMGSQGFSMLRREASAPTTLGEKKMQAAREESKLSRAVRSLNDALEAALGSWAAFYGITDGGSITMNRDFVDNYLSADEVRTLSELEDEGKLTYPTFIRQIQKRTTMLDGVDIEQEIKSVQEERAQEQFAPEPAGSVLLPVNPAALGATPST